jgi:RNA polymerase sigma factor (sigma-70 family)
VQLMESVPSSDEILLQRYAGGDAKSFEVLYQRHEMRVWRYLHRNVRHVEMADDLMQDVWFSVARDAARYQPSARFSTWLFTIAHNRMVDAIRASRPQVSLEALEADGQPTQMPLIDDPRRGPHAGAIAHEQARALNGAVAALPPEQREAFLLHVEAQLTVEEIATITACSFETAKSRLRYARSKLRELLKEYL